MATVTYTERRAELETYFDRTASEAWAKLTSDAPVSGIRATVRAGRDAMREKLLSWLPEDLTGARILDAGCGPGQLAFELARRGGEVTGVDLSATLLDLARERAETENLPGTIDFKAGDMLDPNHGSFDYVVSMDSLIHYPAPSIAESLARLAERTGTSIVFTFAPRTAALSVMHTVGSLFPRSDRAPAIEPVSEATLRKEISRRRELGAWTPARTEKVSSGFYISQGMELAR